MNILFIYTNINGFHENDYSFGLASIVSSIKKAGHTPTVLIARERSGYGRIMDEVARSAPKIVGFSSVSSQFGFVKEISTMVKNSFPDIITVCGGVHPTIAPECALEPGSPDYLFRGESELSFVDFVDKVDRGASAADTENLAFAKEGKLVVNKLRPLLKDLDILPYPDRETYPYGPTIKKIGYAPFFFSRGCPYACSYCSNHAIARVYGLPTNTPRYRSPESSICEIEQVVKRFSVNTISIGDDIFGLDKAWREDFCIKYKNRIKIRFFCFLRANLVTEDFIKLLKDAGCYRISIGVESGNEHVRNDVMNRSMSNAQIEKAFGIIHRNGMLTNAINIIGTPGETESAIMDTIKLNRKIKPTSSGVNIFYPYRGTRLGDYCFQNDMVDLAGYLEFSNERRDTVLKCSDEYKRMLIRYRENWERLVYPHDIKRALFSIARKTPVWEYLRKSRNFVRDRIKARGI